MANPSSSIDFLGMGIKGISKSQVSVMAKSLDEEVKAFCDRPLDGGPYT